MTSKPAPPNSDRLTAREVAHLLGCCSGKIGKLVWQGELPAPDDRGLFDRQRLYSSNAWRKKKC